MISTAKFLQKLSTIDDVTKYRGIPVSRYFLTAVYIVGHFLIRRIHNSTQNRLFRGRPLGFNWYGKTKPNAAKAYIHQSNEMYYKKINTTRMWANAQHDGRPAEYRWDPLFNAAKFGWRPLPECHAVTLPRLKARWNKLGCRKLAVSGPRFTILCGHVEEILLFNQLFFRLSICALVAKI